MYGTAYDCYKHEGYYCYFATNTLRRRAEKAKLKLDKHIKTIKNYITKCKKKTVKYQLTGYKEGKILLQFCKDNNINAELVESTTQTRKKVKSVSHLRGECEYPEDCSIFISNTRATVLYIKIEYNTSQKIDG
jgi:hypothetical protein